MISSKITCSRHPSGKLPRSCGLVTQGDDCREIDSCGSWPDGQQTITLVRLSGRREGGYSGLPVKSPPGREPRVGRREARRTNFRQVSRGIGGGTLTSSLAFANGDAFVNGEKAGVLGRQVTQNKNKRQ